MCDVRRVFDPARPANPAKILPVHVCREWIGPATRIEPAPRSGGESRQETTS